MSLYNNVWYKVSEPHVDFTTNKCVVKIESWATEQDKIDEVNGLPVAMCLFSFINWDYETISSFAIAKYSEWLPYDKELIETWLLPEQTLNEFKAIRSSEISQACANFITAGFSSTALGVSNLYPCNDRDQSNLAGTVLRSTLPLTSSTDQYFFLCRSLDGVWDFRPHNAAQIQQVGTDSYNFILNARIKNATLQSQLAQATTKEGASAIVW